MLSSLPEPQKERGFPFTPSRKKKLLKLKRESTRYKTGPRYAGFCYSVPHSAMRYALELLPSTAMTRWR